MRPPPGVAIQRAKKLLFSDQKEYFKSSTIFELLKQMKGNSSGFVVVLVTFLIVFLLQTVIVVIRTGRKKNLDTPLRGATYTIIIIIISFM